MTEKDINTEQRILAAAKQLFMQKGMKATTTQEIATVAGVNKALLHYYFRSKEKLHLAVFQDVMKINLPGLVGIMIARRPFAERIRAFVAVYIDVLSHNSFLAHFLVHEIQQNPDRFIQLFNQFEPQRMFKIINRQLQKEGICHLSAIDLMINMVSMCIFPFIITPVIDHVIFKDQDEAKFFLLSRKQSVADFIINALYHENSEISSRNY